MATLCMASMPWTRSDDYFKAMVDNYGAAGYKTEERIEPDGKDANYFIIRFKLWDENRAQIYADGLKNRICNGFETDKKTAALLYGLYRIEVQPDDYTIEQFMSEP